MLSRKWTLVALLLERTSSFPFVNFLFHCVQSLLNTEKPRSLFSQLKGVCMTQAEPRGKPLSKPESHAGSLKPAVAHLSKAAAQA